MPYQLSTQSLRKNWETPVHVAGIIGVTSGGALVTRSTSAASARFGPNNAPAARIATAIPVFLITILPRETKPQNCRRPGTFAPAIDRTRPGRLAGCVIAGKYG